MNEIQTIRDALELGLSHKDACLFDPEICTCFAARTYRASKEALSLLSPEGETHHYSFDDIRQAACNIVGACKTDVPEDEKIDYADERIRGLFPEPAPSSEKALRDAFESGYSQGHNDTVEGAVRDMHDAANDYLASSPAPSGSPYSGDPTTCECDYHKAQRQAPAPETPKQRWRGCTTCKHGDLEIHTGPCVGCHGVIDFPHWIDERSATT